MKNNKVTTTLLLDYVKTVGIYVYIYIFVCVYNFYYIILFLCVYFLYVDFCCIMFATVK